MVRHDAGGDCAPHAPERPTRGHVRHLRGARRSATRPRRLHGRRQMITQPSDIKQWADAMRACGVVRLVVGEQEIDLAAAVARAPQHEGPDLPKDFGEPERCACGHGDAEHNEHGCLLGCDTRACTKAAEAEKTTMSNG